MTCFGNIFGYVIIPEGVLFELQASSSFDISKFLALEWVKVEKLSDRASVQVFLHTLDLGEAEAISLAQSLNADLLMDERKGRAVARSLGLKTTGAFCSLLKIWACLLKSNPCSTIWKKKQGFGCQSLCEFKYSL